MVNLIAVKDRFEDQPHVFGEVVVQALDRRPVALDMLSNRHVATQVRKLHQTPELADLNRRLVKRFEKSDEARSRNLCRTVHAAQAENEDLLALQNGLRPSVTSPRNKNEVRHVREHYMRGFPVIKKSFLYLIHSGHYL